MSAEQAIADVSIRFMKEIAAKDAEIARLRAGLQALDLMIFTDPQIIERAGEFRREIAELLAPESRPDSNVPQ